MSTSNAKDYMKESKKYFLQKLYKKKEQHRANPNNLRAKKCAEV